MKFDYLWDGHILLNFFYGIDSFEYKIVRIKNQIIFHIYILFVIFCWKEKLIASKGNWKGLEEHIEIATFQTIFHKKWSNLIIYKIWILGMSLPWSRIGWKFILQSFGPFLLTSCQSIFRWLIKGMFTKSEKSKKTIAYIFIKLN